MNSEKCSLATNTFYVFLALMPLENVEILTINMSGFSLGIPRIILSICFGVFIVDFLLNRVSINRAACKYIICLLCLVLLSIVNMLYVYGYGYNVAGSLSLDIKMTLNLIFYVLLIIISLHVLMDLNRVIVALRLVCISTTVIVLATIMKSLGLNLIGFQREVMHSIGYFTIGVVGLLDGPLSFSMLMLATLPMIYMNINLSNKASRIVWALFLLFSTIIVYSRNLWVSTIVQLLILVLLKEKHLRRSENIRERILIILFAAILLCIAIFNFAPSAYRIREHTVDMRIEGFKYILERIFLDIFDLMFGLGKGPVASALGNVEGKEAVVIHNFVVGILVSKGLIYLFVQLYFIYMVCRDLYRNILNTVDPNMILISIVLISGLIGMIMEGMFAPIENSLAFWALISISISYQVNCQTCPDNINQYKFV